MKKPHQNPAGSKRPPLATADRNFDDLAPRFARNVYGGHKGELRLAVLQRDFEQCLPGYLATDSSVPGRRILDAGGGQGQFSAGFAEQHQLTLCDISAGMLALAAEQPGAERIRFIHTSIQSLAEQPEHREQYDLVICHAVLEWVVEQEALLTALYCLVRPGGHLSLTFYNAHGLAFKSLLRGQAPTILTGEFRPHRGSLTPNRPVTPAQVMQWLGEDRWTLVCHSGIRVFSDYLLTPEGKAMAPEQRLEWELTLSRQEPYRSLGRYQHMLLEKIVG